MSHIKLKDEDPNSNKTGGEKALPAKKSFSFFDHDTYQVLR